MTDNSFDEFWAAYPLKRAKISARTVWDRMVRKYPAADIIAGAQKYAAECQGKEPQYIKYPQGWLSAGRWMDYETQEQAKTGSVIQLGTPQWHAWREHYLRIGRPVAFMDAHGARGGSLTMETEWPPIGEAVA